ncbi:MAG: MoxR family ATPase [Firmicutes bacterium]|nr:MoxR family ATPase [Bacillota bacterium]
MLHSDKMSIHGNNIDTVIPELQQVIANVEKVIVGKRHTIELLVTAILAEGHVLLDDVPGVGKTTLAKSIAASLHLSYSRIQFTPDLLPSDITGIGIYNPALSQFVFQPGPIFAHLILADEINRTSPRTQSALLEVMEEGQVTVDGHQHRLDRPFVVIATENPIEYEGTFPLPESQLDRFLFRIQLGYPSIEEETEMLSRLESSHPLDTLQPVLTQDQLLNLINKVSTTYVSPAIRQYIAQLAERTREHNRIYLGMSPRAAIALQRSSQAWAFLHGRTFVIPDDVRMLAPLVLTHRLSNPIVPRDDTRAIVREVIDDIVAHLPVTESHGKSS